MIRTRLAMTKRLKRPDPVDQLMPPPSSSASQHATLLTGIVVGSSLTLLVTWVLQKKRESHHQQQGDKNARLLHPDVASSEDTTSKRRRRLPDHVREEQLSRHALYFGPGGVEMIRNSHVAVVGLGGVGSHSAIMLARGGVEHLTLVDFDMVTVSSLNRHACAALRDVGIPKVTCVANAIQDIAGEGTVDVAAHVEMLTGESAPRLIPSSEVSSSLCSKPISMVVDAIDDVPTKAALISHCLRHKIRVISCMGAGGKADVTRLHVSDLRTASRDPLASKLRQFLKKDFLGGGGENGGGDASSYLDDMSRLTIVYSTEKIVAKLADFTDEQREEGVHRFGAIDGMRIRVVPVLGTMPAVMGQSLAAVALTELGRKPFQPVAGERVGRSTRHTTLQRLNAREKRIEKRVLAEAGLDALPDPSGCRVHGTWIGPTQVDDDDVEYLLEIWRNRCGISNARLGASLELVRWKASEPAACDNLVLMSAATVKRYDQEGKQWISPDAQRRVHERLATCQLDR